jgi:hypothetical protein
MWYLGIDPTLGLGHTAVEGVDFESNNRVFTSTFPTNTIMHWRVPNFPPASAGVYGFLHVSYGNYDGDAQQVPVTPQQVYTLTNFTENLNFTTTATSSNLLNEFYLTSASGNSTAKLFEVGMFPNVPSTTATFVNGATQLGSFVDPGGRAWTVAQSTGAAAPYIVFMPTNLANVTGTVYWQDMLGYLIAQGVITGNEWINGVAVGTEPYTGSGTTTINTFSVNFTGAARVPWTVANLSAVAQSNTTVLLSFASPPGATSLQYQVNGGTWTSLPGNDIITGLTASTAYTFAVRGVNATGNAAASNTASATTQSSSHDLDFILQAYKWNSSQYSTLSSLFTAAGKGSFARSTSGYDLAATTLFSSNTPRITSVGLLIEPSATNYMLWSQVFDDTDWSKQSGATVTANATNAPDGTATADNLTTNNYFLALVRSTLGLTNTNTYTVSVFGKNISGTVPLLLDFQGPGGGPSVTLNSSTWTRGSFTGAAGGTNNMFIYNGGAGSTNAYWGAQVEAGATSTSYIPTTSTSATRGADALVLAVPSGKTGALVTFSDNSTQTVTGLTGGSTWAVPTNLNKPIIKYIDWQ